MKNFLMAIINFFRPKKPSVPEIHIPIDVSVPGSSGSPKMGQRFPDISHYEICDFDKFKGNDMIFKATEGTSYIDKTMKRNLKECIKRGIRFGVYHFYRADRNPITQARHFINTVGLETLKTMYHLPIVDYETSKGQNKRKLKDGKNNLLVFLQYLESKTGRKSRIYSGDYLMKYIGFETVFTKHCENPWVARYSSKFPENKGPWPGIWAWQYSDNEHFDGIGKCDVNHFMDV